MHYRIKKEVIQNDKIELDAVFENSGFLVVKNNYYPEWELYINNQKKSIYKVNLIHMGFFVPKGANKIEMRFNNKPFKKGLAVSSITLLFYAALLKFVKRDFLV